MTINNDSKTPISVQTLFSRSDENSKPSVIRIANKMGRALQLMVKNVKIKDSSINLGRADKKEKDVYPKILSMKLDTFEKLGEPIYLENFSIKSNATEKSEQQSVSKLLKMHKDFSLKRSAHPFIGALFGGHKEKMNAAPTEENPYATIDELGITDAAVQVEAKKSDSIFKRNARSFVGALFERHKEKMNATSHKENPYATIDELGIVDAAAVKVEAKKRESIYGAPDEIRARKQLKRAEEKLQAEREAAAKQGIIYDSGNREFLI